MVRESSRTVRQQRLVAIARQRKEPQSSKERRPAMVEL